MNESLVWGSLGVLLAIGGVAIIVPDVLTELQHGGLGSPMVLYGIAVVAAAALTALIILPSFASNR